MNNRRSKIRQALFTETNLYGAGLYLRRYFPIGGKFYFHLAGGLFYDRYEQKGLNGSVVAGRTESDVAGAGLTPSVSFSFGKRIVFETALPNILSLSYASSRSTDGSGQFHSRNKTFGGYVGAGGSVPLSLGFNIIFGK